jgi:hypothetical protein
MGSDGLLDNMSEVEIVSEVSKLIAAGAKPAAMAQRIAKVRAALRSAGVVLLVTSPILLHRSMRRGAGSHVGAA